MNGSLSFTAASSYMVEIAPTNADRVNVTGTATLGGATVNASFAVRAYVAKQYTILNATGGLGGSTFRVVIVNTNLPQGFKSSSSYDTNNAYLDLALSFIAPPGSGLNGNQQAVANALVNSFNRNGGIPLVYGGLTAPGLTQASGPIATAVQPTMVQAMTQFLTGMTDVHYSDRRPRRFEIDGLRRGGRCHERLRRRAPARYGRRDVQLENKGSAARAGIRIVLGTSAFWDWRRPDHRRQCGHRIQHRHQPAFTAWRLAPTTGCRRRPGRRLRAGGWRHQFRRRLRRQRTNPTCSRPAHSSSTRRAPPMSSAAAAYGWHDVTTDRTVTISGIDQLHARFGRQHLRGPRSKAAIATSHHGSAASVSRRTPPRR